MMTPLFTSMSVCVCYGNRLGLLIGRFEVIAPSGLGDGDDSSVKPQLMILPTNEQHVVLCVNFVNLLATRGKPVE